ncbi:MAG: hypothetical protein JXR07_05120 [Reichenbachiella sp.]
MLKSTLIFLFLFLLIGTVQAQEKSISLEDLSQITFTDSTIFKIELKTGSIVVGKIVKSNSRSFQILSEDLGVIEVLKDNISGIIVTNTESIIEKTVDKSDKIEMAGAYHNLVTNTGYNVPKGEGYLQFTQIFLVSGGYGISKNFSISGGMSVFPGAKFEDQLFFVLPRASIQVVKNVNLSAFVMPITVGGEKTVLWGASSTFGSRDRNFTVGYTSGNDLEEASLLNFSGVFRVSRKVALLSDNLLGIDKNADNVFVGSLGIRLIGANGAFDFGMLLAEDFEGYPIPFISYNFRL